MKTRATSCLLATLAVVSLILPALAADSDAMPEETFAKSEEIEEVEMVSKAVLLDGEPAETVEFEIVDGVCYVTVSSFVSLMDAEAMVEEENGVVTVSTSTVIEVVALDEATDESVPVEPTEPTEEAEPIQSVEYAADVVTADLDLTAVAGGDYVVANDRYLYAQDGLIQINGRVAAPVRLLAQVFNLDVGYDAENELVLLSHQEGAEPYLTDGSLVYDGDALYWLSHIIYAESGNQPLEGKVAVGNVVMNRVNDPRFPDNIYEVLFQKNQFSPTSSGSIYREPNEESVLAAKLVMDGAQVTDALFFNGVRIRAPKGRTYVTTIGDHAFYK